MSSTQGIEHNRFIDEFSNPVKNSYRPEDLVEAVVWAMSPIEDFEPSMDATLSSELLDYWVNSVQDVNMLLELVFPILDDMFFCKSLGRVMPNGAIAEAADGESVQGVFIAPQNIIKIYVQEVPCLSDDPVHHYVQVLMHEMVHAFLAHYRCKCDECLSEELPLIGRTGHGTAFLDILLAMKNHVKAEGWCGDTVSLGLPEAILIELKSGWNPTNEVLQRWGMRWNSKSFQHWKLRLINSCKQVLWAIRPQARRMFLTIAIPAVKVILFILGCILILQAALSISES